METVEDFLAALKETGIRFQAEPFRYIRAERTRSCPIVALANHRLGKREYDNWNAKNAGRFLEMDRELVQNIINSADGISGRWYDQIRKQLLKVNSNG